MFKNKVGRALAVEMCNIVDENDIGRPKIANNYGAPSKDIALKFL